MFGAYGYITQGIIRELVAEGLRVPDDWSVISMDNDPYPLDDTLDVACIPSDVERICDCMLELLEARMQAQTAPLPCRTVLPASFYKGNSIQKI